MLLLSGIGFAYNPEHTHPKLNHLAADVVKKPDVDPDRLYSELQDFIAQLEAGAKEEDHLDFPNLGCEVCRCTRHSYHPITEQGYIQDSEQCMNAVEWARDDRLEGRCQGGDNDGNHCIPASDCPGGSCVHAEGEHLTWYGAILQYGYTHGSKAEAYKRLGHVGHLVGDMAQPDHVHLEHHRHIAFCAPGSEDVCFLGDQPDDDHIEGWTVDHWDCMDSSNPCSVGVKPNSTDILPRRFYDMESHLKELARLTWSYSTYGGHLNEHGTNSASGEITEMFDVDWDGATWTLENTSEMDPGFQENLGNWQGGSGGQNACEIGGLENDEGDDWWETQTETEWEDRVRSGILCDLFAFEEMDDAIPAKFKVYRWDVNGDLVIIWRDQGHDGTRYSLSEIYTRNLLREAVAHIAGLYMHFLDVVAHPPIVMIAEYGQGTIGSFNKYRKSWHLQGDLQRFLRTDLPYPKDGGWINGVDGPAVMYLLFGSDYDEELDYVPRNMSRKQGDVNVRLLRGEQVVEVPGALSPRNAAVWNGEILVPADGSLNGRWTMEISAKDAGPHLPAEIRSITGHDLDSDPSTLAFAREDQPNVYSWLGYQPGTDRNHEILIDATAPLMNMTSGKVDPPGKTVAQFAVSDPDSGIQSIDVADSGNASVVVSGSEITITHDDSALSGYGLVGLSDVAGNQAQQSIIIPFVESCTRAVDAEGNIAMRVTAYGDSGFDPRSVKIGGWEFGTAKWRSGAYKDANGDGVEDLVLYYSMNESGGGTECLTARSSDGAFVASCQALGICDGDHDGIADFDDLCPLVTAFTLTGCGSALAVTGGGVPCSDADADGACDAQDNCRGLANADQLDSDGDGVGNGCDNCPEVANADQLDSNGDRVGDACDNTPGTVSFDADGDGVADDVDNCPSVSNTDQTDSDSDEIGDACAVSPEPEPGQNVDEPGPAPRICGKGACGSVGGANLTLIVLGMSLYSMRRRR